jgi:hypothetical protein
MKRILRILWAEIRCNFYLLHPRHFLKEQQWTTYREDKVCLIVAIQGQPKLSEKDGKVFMDFEDCELKKIFYADLPLEHPKTE